MNAVEPIVTSLLVVLLVVVVAAVGVGAILVAKVWRMAHALRVLQAQVQEQSPAQIVSGVQTVQMAQTMLAEQMGRTAMGVESLVPTVQSLRQELRVLHEKAEARAAADRQAQSMLRRLELVMAGGSQRGAAGENILSEVLGQLPPGMRDNDVRIGGKVVEFALRLPGDKFLPIDSKWPESSMLERLERLDRLDEGEVDPRERSDILRRLEKTVLARASEVAKYLDPERTVMLGVAAIPDAVYHASVRAHAEAYRLGVIIIPYSLAVPYVLSVLVLVWRFGEAVDFSEVRGGLLAVNQSLERVLGIVESHLARAATMTENASTRIRSEVLDARRALEAIRIGEREDPTSSVRAARA